MLLEKFLILKKIKFNMALTAEQKRKVLGAISYITWAGWFVAFIINKKKTDQFTSFHIRQALLLHIIASVAGFIPFLNFIVVILYVIALIYGIYYALQEQEQEIPYIGEYAQDWFRGV